MLPTPQRPPLDVLQDELRALGMVVVPRAGGFEVRLSLLESVRVSVHEGTLRCEPRSGAAPRARASWLLVFLTAVVTTMLVHNRGITSQTLGMMFLLLAGIGFHGMRYVATEATITKIQLLWAQLRPRGVPGLGASSDVAESFGTAAAQRPLLAEPAPRLQNAPEAKATTPR